MREGEGEARSETTCGASRSWNGRRRRSVEDEAVAAEHSRARERYWQVQGMMASKIVCSGSSGASGGGRNCRRRASETVAVWGRFRAAWWRGGVGV